MPPRPWLRQAGRVAATQPHQTACRQPPTGPASLSARAPQRHPATRHLTHLFTPPRSRHLTRNHARPQASRLQDTLKLPSYRQALRPPGRRQRTQPPRRALQPPGWTTARLGLVGEIHAKGQPCNPPSPETHDATRRSAQHATQRTAQHATRRTAQPGKTTAAQRGCPPLPIPNRAVKTRRANGTALTSGRVGSRRHHNPLNAPAAHTAGASVFIFEISSSYLVPPIFSLCSHFATKPSLSYIA